MFCSKCGAKVPENAKFCIDCGEVKSGAQSGVNAAVTPVATQPVQLQAEPIALL